jgi:hypothetical protein
MRNVSLIAILLIILSMFLASCSGEETEPEPVIIVVGPYDDWEPQAVADQGLVSGLVAY